MLKLDFDEESCNDEPFLTTIKENLLSFRIMLKTIDTLPDFVILNCTSEIGNEVCIHEINISNTLIYFIAILVLFGVVSYLSLILRVTLVEFYYNGKTFIDE